MRMTGQRRIIARVLSEANDHPDVEDIQRFENFFADMPNFVFRLISKICVK